MNSKVLYGDIYEASECDCEVGWGAFFATAYFGGMMLDLREFSFDREDLVSRKLANESARSWLEHMAEERGLTLEVVPARGSHG